MKRIPEAMVHYVNTHSRYYMLAIKPVKGSSPAFAMVTASDILQLALTPMFTVGTDGVARYQARGISETRRDLAKAGVKPIMVERCRHWVDALDFERACVDALNGLGYSAKWKGAETYFGGTREAARDIDELMFGRIECKSHGGRLAKWISAEVEQAWY